MLLKLCVTLLLANKLGSVIRAHKSKARTKATSPSALKREGRRRGGIGT